MPSVLVHCTPNGALVCHLAKAINMLLLRSKAGEESMLVLSTFLLRFVIQLFLVLKSFHLLTKKCRDLHRGISF